MRADRLLSLMWLLRARGQVSTAELAAELEVSRRTILRDLEALSSSGVPVYCERGRHGGVRLLPGYRMDINALNSEESRALFAGVTTWGAESLGLGEALSSGLRKLLAAVPDEHRSASAELASRIVIDPQGWLRSPDADRLSRVLDVLQGAVMGRSRVQLSYRSKGKAAARRWSTDPLGLVSSGSDWYLCVGTADRILFLRLSRIEAVLVLAEPCAVPPIDVAEEWRKHRAQFWEHLDPVSVVATVSETRLTEVREGAISVQESGQALRMEFMDRLHALTVLLRLGADATVLEPEWLRDELVDYAQAIVDRYPPPADQPPVATTTAS